MSGLLTSLEVARFVQQGFLRFDRLIDRASCEELLAEIKSGRHQENTGYGRPLAGIWPEGSILRRIFCQGRVLGICESLLGPNPIYDHHYPHVSKPGERRYDDLHQDAIYDRREFAFDIQLSLFPQDTTLEMGGTLVVPGSHLRRVHTGDIHRYQHVIGQVQVVCDAGTLLVWHNNLWHSGRSNHSQQERTMFKLRLQPSGRQYRCWDTSDLAHPEIARILAREHPFHGVDGRMGVMNQLALWRYLSGELPHGELPHYGYYLDRR